MARNHPLPLWPLRLFKVVEDSMRPTLHPGDGLVGLRSGVPKTGQLRLFRDPRRSTRWLVKRVGEVYGEGPSTIFEARSDNPRALGAVDSHELGWVRAAGTYRVMYTMRAPGRRDG